MALVIGYDTAVVKSHRGVSLPRASEILWMGEAAGNHLALLYTSRNSLAQLRITDRGYVTSPETNKDEGLCGGAARRSAAEPEAPRRGAEAHTSCYGTLRLCKSPHQRSNHWTI